MFHYLSQPPISRPHLPSKGFPPSLQSMAPHLITPVLVVLMAFICAVASMPRFNTAQWLCRAPQLDFSLLKTQFFKMTHTHEKAPVNGGSSLHTMVYLLLNVTSDRGETTWDTNSDFKWCLFQIDPHLERGLPTWACDLDTIIGLANSLFDSGQIHSFVNVTEYMKTTLGSAYNVHTLRQMMGCPQNESRNEDGTQTRLWEDVIQKLVAPSSFIIEEGVATSFPVNSSRVDRLEDESPVSWSKSTETTSQPGKTRVKRSAREHTLPPKNDSKVFNAKANGTVNGTGTGHRFHGPKSERLGIIVLGVLAVAVFFIVYVYWSDGPRASRGIPKPKDSDTTIAAIHMAKEMETLGLKVGRQ